jgi:hypothetical protein
MKITHGLFPFGAEPLESIEGVFVVVEQIEAVKQQGDRARFARGQYANVGRVGLDGARKINNACAPREKFINISHGIPLEMPFHYASEICIKKAKSFQRCDFDANILQTVWKTPLFGDDEVLREFLGAGIWFVRNSSKP